LELGPRLQNTRVRNGRAEVRSLIRPHSSFVGIAILCVLGVEAAGVSPNRQAVAPRYRIDPLPRTLPDLTKAFTAQQIDLLEKLNRRDRDHLLRTEPPVPGLIVPLTWEDDELAYSPLPLEWPAAESHAKAVVVHQPSQAFGAYENGKLVRWGPVSTGRKETPTPEGTYNLTWKARSRRSTDNQAWLLEWYFNFINARGVSFHQFDLPGAAASHACVRMLRRDAEWLYQWGEQWQLDSSGKTVTAPGTPVLVIGTYAFAAPPPWTSLDWLERPIELPAAM
jgi:L,D-transpeptidase catalytic domain